MTYGTAHEIFKLIAYAQRLLLTVHADVVSCRARQSGTGRKTFPSQNYDLWKAFPSNVV